MSLATTRASIKTVLDGVSGIGQTHDYFRRIENETEWKAIAVSAGIGHVWMVSLSDTDPYLTRRHPANHELGTYQYSLHGYYAVDDDSASEKTFANVVEGVIAAFRADKKLGDTVVDSGPAEWRQGGYLLFGSVLCHYARLDLPVTEQTEP